MTCRSCGAAPLVPVLELGPLPLAEGLLSADQLSEPESFASLELVYCPQCTLAQLSTTSDWNEAVGSERYRATITGELLSYFHASADALIASRRLGAESMVIQAASADGYMLARFNDAGISVLGIDSVEDFAAAATARGIYTIRGTFGKAFADELSGGLGVAGDLFLANDALNRVSDLNGFADAIAALLKPDGLAVIEVPYLLDLVDSTAFDALDNQHLSYFSVTALDKLFSRAGLYVNDVERTWPSGGSLRLFVEKTDGRVPRFLELIELERRRGIADLSFYHGLIERAASVKRDLGNLLRQLHGDGSRIAAFGAEPSGSTLCSYVGIGTELVDYVVDESIHKTGRFLGGNHLPIVSPRALEDSPPDFVLLLAWRLADQIVGKYEHFRALGGCFIVPIPEVKVIV